MDGSMDGERVVGRSEMSTGMSMILEEVGMEGRSRRTRMSIGEGLARSGSDELAMR